MVKTIMAFNIGVCIICSKILLFLIALTVGILYGSSFLIGVGIGTAVSTGLSVLLWIGLFNEFERVVRKY